MAYFAIKEEGCEDRCVCCEESLEDVEAVKMLGPGDWVIREIGEDEANRFAVEWQKENTEDACPICEGPRSRVLRGEITMKLCKSCEFES